MSKWVVNKIGKVQVWYSEEVIDEIVSICQIFINDCDICTYENKDDCDNFDCENFSAKNLTDEIFKIVKNCNEKGAKKGGR